MAHERREIRDAIVARLIAANVTGGRVDKSRLDPAKAAELPLVSVYNEIEPIREGSEKGSAELERQFEVTIVAWTHAGSAAEVDDELDDLALAIERVMDAPPLGLNGHASSVRLANTQFGIDLKGSRPLGAVSLTYRCDYFTGPRNAAPTDIFDTATSRTSLDNEQAEADQRQSQVTGINDP